jgi:atlastin
VVQYVDKNNEIKIDAEAMDEMFLHPDVKDRKIVAVSIAGAYRKGKSFFLGYCLRFMYANVSDEK